MVNILQKSIDDEKKIQMDLLKVWKYSGAFGDFRPENHTFCPLLIINLMMVRVRNCHYIVYMLQIEIGNYLN